MTAAAQKPTPTSKQQRADAEMRRVRAEDAAARASRLVREQTARALSEIARARGQLDAIFAELQSLSEYEEVRLRTVGPKAYVDGCQALHRACDQLRHLVGVDELTGEKTAW